jgi:hypothetical protein
MADWEGGMKREKRKINDKNFSHIFLLISIEINI